MPRWQHFSDFHLKTIILALKMGVIELGVNAIIRPPRAVYPLDQLPGSMFVPNYGEVVRVPVEFRNSRGLRIVGSYWAPFGEIAEPSCVVYLHGNASCQLEGMFLVPIFVPAGVSVLCFDCAGSGNSEGEYISLGVFERDDVACAINFVRERFRVGRVALWGRSMGAGTSFFALADDPTIACCVADSPYASLRQLIRELAGRFHVPGCLSSMAVNILRRRIRTKAGFDIRDVEPLSIAPNCFTPIFIIHGEADSFIRCDHSRELFAAYGGEDKEIHIEPGIDHNSERPLELISAAALFVARVLDAPVCISDIYDLIQSAHYHFAGVEDMLTGEQDH